MDPSRNIQRDHVIHDGTDLLLCHGTRHVRVLTLPRLCNNRRLLHGWTACLGDEPEIPGGGQAGQAWNQQSAAKPIDD